MSKVFIQKLRMAASEADDLLTSCDASDLLDGLEVARDFMFEAASMIEERESRLAQVERERDAAVADLSNSCAYCKHTSGSVDEPPCTECFHPKNNIIFAPMTRTKFEWRGVCPENTKEDSR